MKKHLIKRIKRLFKKIIWTMVFLTTIISAYSLTFSEIMYNPQGSDTGREWIELSNPNCDNLEEYKLFENNINHNINLYSNGTCDYPIICDDCELFLSENNVSSTIYESSFTLSNTGEYLEMRLNNTMIDSVNYTGMQNIEGMSITKYDEWINTWPTPGYFILQENNQTINETINNVTINETINTTLNETINITLNETLNETINITINETQNENKCNITLGIKLKDDKLIYYNKESIKFYNTLNVSPGYKIEYNIEYWVEDIYGNILKNNLQTNNLNEKSYTPSVTEKTVAIIIKNRLINISCNNSVQTNILNEFSERIIIIKNLEYTVKECKKCESTPSSAASSTASDIESKENSELSISINDGMVELDAYRGDDRKYVINVYIKNDKKRKVADILKLNLEKYSGTHIESALKLEGCGEFEVFAEGLGFVKSQTYHKECETESEIKNALAEQLSTQSSIQPSAYYAGPASNNTESRNSLSKNTSQFFHEPLITGQIVYESKNEKTKEYSLIGILVLLTGTAIYLIYKKILKK